ncbi:MAG: hypothetical protein JW884_12145 [Deltaproteobacteria bacterium]|nr:hypothetical protein [Deltaproteobacteria bacterium]
MIHRKKEEGALITADMTLVAVMEQFPAAEAVFRMYDSQAGTCLCCQALFDTIDDIVERYGLDGDALLRELREAASANA